MSESISSSCSLVFDVCLMVRVNDLGDLPIIILGLLSLSVRKRMRVEEGDII